MAADELVSRVRRIYAAIDAAQEFDMSRLPGKVVNSPLAIGIFQDFSGDLSEEDLSNAAHLVIHNIANLGDHLRRWAAKNGQDKTRVNTTFTGSQPLQIVQDLSNNDKHGYPPRDGGHSGLAPQLTAIRRVMKLTTKPRAGSAVMMVLGADGRPQVSGDGSACAVVTGDVIDRDGKRLGDLHALEQQAVQAWESLLGEYGIGA